ncbi:MAG: ATP-binding protein [Thermodesulfobacteriota bacterium]
MIELNRKANRLIGRAMHDYAMLADNDRVMIAVSGGVDSLVLLSILKHWQKKAPISYELLAVHLDMGFGEAEAEMVDVQLERLGVSYLIEKTDIGPQAMQDADGKSGCFHCSRRRRNRLFDLAQEKGFTKIALGHHKEDIIETFYINMMYGGNLSTMVPRQDLFEGRLSLIRPMAYLEKEAIKELGRQLEITPVANPCPLSGTSKRQEIRDLLESIYAKDETIKSTIFSSLANVKLDYLLKNTI